MQRRRVTRTGSDYFFFYDNTTDFISMSIAPASRRVGHLQRTVRIYQSPCYATTTNCSVRFLLFNILYFSHFYHTQRKYVCIKTVN